MPDARPIDYLDALIEDIARHEALASECQRRLNDWTITADEQWEYRITIRYHTRAIEYRRELMSDYLAIPIT